LHTTAQQIEDQIRAYAKQFLECEYGEQAKRKLEAYSIQAVDAYDTGGVSEATATTKLIVRHELGHILDDTSPVCADFEEEILHERIAWANAKPKTPAEEWYKAVSIRAHVDPLKMQAIGFPRPERKVAVQKLKMGVKAEMQRMGRSSLLVDAALAERFAMFHLVEDPNYYS
jgi:hypothetical protein